MATKKKALQAAAGNAGGVIAPEGVSFDGATDYLGLTSGLTGSVDSATFTFSAWVYPGEGAATDYIFTCDTTYFRLYWTGTGFALQAKNASGTTVFNNTAVGTANAWNHVLVSVDLSSTSRRWFYVNEVLDTSYTTYTNSQIDFTRSNWSIASAYATSASSTLKGRLAHVYLDFTYRNLSIEANRRLFITADRKPAAGLASLSPILYLPLIDADTAGVNEGTGGDFTVNGVLDTVQRGANQNNCVAGYFDGGTDSLTAYLTTARTFSNLTFSFTHKHPESSSNAFFNSRGRTYFDGGSAGTGIRCLMYNESLSLILSVTLKPTLFNTANTKHITCSVNFTTGEKYFFVDGIDYTNNTNAVTWDTLVTGSGGPHFVNTTNYNNYTIAGTAGSGGSVTSYSEMTHGEFYIGDEFHNLTTNNPFWDAVSNRPKPVRQVLDETGSTPLIAMPIESANAGLNLGNWGSNFSGNNPSGARGGSEFWARSMDTTGVGYLRNSSAPTTPATSKTFTLVVATKLLIASTSGFIFTKTNNYTNEKFYLSNKGTGRLGFVARNGSNTIILNTTMADNSYAANQWYINLISVDLSSTSLRKWYRNGVDYTSNVTWSTYTNDFIDFGEPEISIGARGNGDSPFRGEIGFVYFTTDYIDFTQESNRNLFVDQLGYPKDLTNSIEDGYIPTPMVYTRFDVPLDLGANSGTGGDFTVNNTVNPGSDVDPYA